jgi:hypothetical protein
MRWMPLCLLLTFAAPAAAQRSTQVVPNLTSDDLSGILENQEDAIGRCASRTDASAYVASVHTRVSPGPAPSTLFHAAISVSVISRPRDSRFEGCVRRVVLDALRNESYAVPRSVRASHTYQIAERPTPPIDRPSPPFAESEVQRVLASYRGMLQQCLELAGVPEQVTLRVAVRPDGRLVLTSADVPSGSSSNALGCLSSRVSRLRVEGRPSRTVTVVHRLGVQSRAF